MAEEEKHEIVIIRRGGHGDHDDHHGGVWKIAFADFMTAMMAFFLVMWLISANDKTRATIARYFNPIHLVDTTTAPQGMQDSKKEESSVKSTSKDNKAPGDEKKAEEKPDQSTNSSAPSSPEAQATPKAKAETPDAKEKRLDATLRDNPYVALAEIVSAKGQSDVPKTQDTRLAAAVLGRRGGDAFRDPFEPQPSPAGSESDDKASDAIKVMKEEPPEAAPPETPKPALVSKNASEATAGDADAEAKAKKAKGAKLASDADADLKERLVGSLKSGGKDSAGPGVDVRRTDEGLVVSLTDTSDFTMFANGSAVPERRVVLLMEKVARILKERAGTVVVRGFTDNKPFKSKRYDNWHLSLDRAQVAHYMLVRGGFDDTRIGHIEGFADRGAQTGVDPSSPLNRRIEILLKDKAS